MLSISLDPAFVDRADIVQYIDLPPPEAIYLILRSCLVELITKGVVAPVVRSCFASLTRETLRSKHPQDVASLNELRAFQFLRYMTETDETRQRTRKIALELFRLAQKCKVSCAPNLVVRCPRVKQFLSRLRNCLDVRFVACPSSHTHGISVSATSRLRSCRRQIPHYKMLLMVLGRPTCLVRAGSERKSKDGSRRWRKSWIVMRES